MYVVIYKFIKLFLIYNFFFFFLDNIYFINADSDRTHIEVCHFNGENRKILLTTKTETPTSIAVDPIIRFIYWADQGQKPTIQVFFYIIIQKKCFFMFLKYFLAIAFRWITKNSYCLSKS